MQQALAEPPYQPDEIRLMIDAAFAEVYGGFERKLDEGTGEYLWRPLEGPEDRPWGKPPQLNDDENNLLGLVVSFTKAQNDDHQMPVGLCIEYIPKNMLNPFRVRFGMPHPQTGAMQPLAEGLSDVLDMAIALAMLNAQNYPFRELHRTLFPLRYMAGANDG